MTIQNETTAFLIAPPGSIAEAAVDRVTVKASQKPGIQRLHVWVKDGKGRAATANMPFEVR